MNDVQRPWLSRHLWWMILLVFAVAYLLQVLGNHYHFRTFGCDLGIFNHALYSYAHFQTDVHPLKYYTYSNFLADHFSLYMMLFSPLYWVGGTQILLILQVASVLFGVLGVRAYVRHKTDRPWLPEICMLHFLTFFGIYSALAFDYHDNVVASMFIPWLLLYVDQRKWLWASICLGMILISKENLALWMIAVCIVMAILYRNDKAARNRLLWMSGVSTVYTVVVMKVIMPSYETFPADLGYYHFYYKSLGATPGEVVKTLLTYPITTIKLFFVNHMGNPVMDGVKPQFYISVLLGGGWVLFYRPIYLLMILPILGMKMWSDVESHWSIEGHYSTEFLPFISVCLALMLMNMRNHRIANALGVLMAVVSMWGTIYIFSNRAYPYYNEACHNIFMKEHYTCEYDHELMERAFALIPDDAALCAKNALVPHVSFREKLYLFPYIKDADYILTTIYSGPYPLTTEEEQKVLDDYVASPEWETLLNEGGVYVFRKNQQ
ncbi:MAG: DUF2079 domain-containing protein [Flavobacteriales bacterium]|nr:DUF2079 domain-containing protein [Flavobacteriales bacterium]